MKNESVKPKKETAAERLDGLIDELMAKQKMSSWTEYITTLQVPSDLLPALMTGRPELARIAPKRALTADECGVLLTLIADLIETNTALRTHAEQVAHQVEIWSDSFKQLQTVGWRIQDFANFRHGSSRETVDDDEAA